MLYYFIKLREIKGLDPGARYRGLTGRCGLTGRRGLTGCRGLTGRRVQADLKLFSREMLLKPCVFKGKNARF